ncbi:MAG TPA: hypothetical protein DCZ80_00345 [Legionellales bacterium]|nr:hypothetical protein [Legionellales bacterium]
MIYSVVSLGYLGAVTHFTYQNFVAYEKTLAPEPLKNIRHAINLVACGFWYALGLYTIFEMSSEALAHLLFLDDLAFDILKELPIIFSMAYFSIQGAILTHRIYLFALYEKKATLDTINIVSDILSFFIELSLYICVFIDSNIDGFKSIILLKVTLNLWKLVLDDVYEIYDKSRRGKKIDWELLLTTLYMNLSLALLMSCLLFNCMVLGDAYLDGIICLMSAFYMCAKTAYDFYDAPQWSNKKIFQVVLLLLQMTIAIALLTEFMVIPQTAILSLILIKALSTSNILVASESLAKKAMEQEKINTLTKDLLKIIDSKDMTVKKYINAQQLFSENVKFRMNIDAPQTQLSMA